MFYAMPSNLFQEVEQEDGAVIVNCLREETGPVKAAEGAPEGLGLYRIDGGMGD